MDLRIGTPFSRPRCPGLQEDSYIECSRIVLTPLKIEFRSEHLVSLPLNHTPHEEFCVRRIFRQLPQQGFQSLTNG